MKHDGNIIRKQRQRKKQTILDVFFIILIVLIYSLVLVIQKADIVEILGYQFYTISSESMSPKINKGDIVIIKKCKDIEIQEGDIITFKADSEVVTHRVKKVNNEDGKVLYITKGDNNNAEDTSYVSYNQVIGKMVKVIPNLGNIVLMLNSKIVLTICILAILVILYKIRKDNLKSKMRREKKKIEDKRNVEQ